MSTIRTAVVGVGNCASSLVQGIHFYGASNQPASGLMHWDLGGYLPSAIEPVLAFDVDSRKVGRDVSEAIFAEPNCTQVFHRDVPLTGVTVKMGAKLDGIASHMASAPPERSIQVSDEPEPSQEDVVSALNETNADVLVNFLPVGSQEATCFYAECALEARVGMVNCMPVFIASNPDWARRFASHGVPIVGDDIKAQLGATILHRALTELFRRRGVSLDKTYQLNYRRIYY